MRDLRGIYSIALLLLFFMKSSAFHIYTHDSEHTDAANHCHTCEIQQLQNHTFFLGATQIYIAAVTINHTPVVFISYASDVFVDAFYFTSVLSRPPPFLV
jgi:hypothetical protein